MMKKIYWLCDLVGVFGAILFLLGIYLAWDLASMLIISGLMLMIYATRISYLLKRDDP